MSHTWLVVGSGPSAATFIDPALSDEPDHTITCNAGYRILANPHYYLLYDTDALNTYADEVPRLRREHGTTFVGTFLYGKQLRMKMAALNPDILIPFKTPPAGKPAYRPTAPWYTPFIFAGSLMVQFAIRHGAKRLLLIGLEGYRTSRNRREIDYFDGREGSPLQGQWTSEVYGPGMQAIANAHPDVTFRFYGEPAYAIAGPNVEVILIGQGQEPDGGVVPFGAEPVPDGGRGASGELPEAVNPMPGLRDARPGELAGELRTEGDLCGITDAGAGNDPVAGRGQPASQTSDTPRDD